MLNSKKTFLVTLFMTLVSYTLCAPVPIPKKTKKYVEEDGLLLLVPTVPLNQRGKLSKNEIDYELISIPGDLIRNTVKEVRQKYGTRGGPLPSADNRRDQTLDSIFISDLKTDENNEILVKRSPPSSLYGRPDSSEQLSTDLSKILSSLASVGLSQYKTGTNFATQAKNAFSTATAVGSSAITQGAKAVKWAVRTKTSGLQSFADFAGNGLQYVGRLTSAILKILLKIPGIKAKIISDIIQAGQPFASSLSEVIADSADDLGEVFNAQSDVLRESLGLMMRFVQDVLKVKGRILASFGAGGLNRGANIISSGVKVGSAFVQSAGDVVNAVGRGVGELVQAVSSANIPSPPTLPKIQFPSLPRIVFDHDQSSEYKAPAAPSSSYGKPDSKEVSILL